jgi:hypothetical protein
VLGVKQTEKLPQCAITFQHQDRNTAFNNIYVTYSLVHLHVLKSKSDRKSTTGSKYVLSDTKTASTINDKSLILSTCTVLVIYKVLALICAWSKSDRKTTTVNKYIPALRQKYSIQL